MASPVPEPVREGSPTLFRRRIAVELKKRRRDAGLNQKAAAEALDRTQQHIANIENNQRPPSSADLQVLLELYGVPERAGFMRNLLRATKRARTWWTEIGSVPEWFDLYLGLEEGAAEIAHFADYLIPGLLQTPAYAAAVVRGDPHLSDDEVQRIVDVRMGRRRILDPHGEAVRLTSVIDELVLERVRGSTEVMREQIDYLLDMSTTPRIELQVLPRDGDAHPAQQGGSFSLLMFPADWVGDTGVVYEEALTGGRYHEQPDELETYTRAMSRLRGIAASPEQSRRILTKIRKEVYT